MDIIGPSRYIHQGSALDWQEQRAADGAFPRDPLTMTNFFLFLPTREGHA